MKRKFIYAAIAAAVLVSCNEKMGGEPENAGKPVNLEVQISCGMTKAVGVTEEQEKKVNDLQVFVFGDGDRLEAYKMVDNAMSLKMGIFSGDKTIYAIANAPELTDVVDFTSFCNKTSDLKNDGIGDFVMVGHATSKIGMEDVTVSIEVSRLVSKVSLVKVENKLSDIYGKLSFKVARAFLVNVVGGITYYSDGKNVPSPKKWYHQRNYVAADGITGLAYDDYSIANIGEAAVHHFYCYPNSTATDSSGKGDWTARFTRLVVEIELNEKSYYYPVDLKNMESNKIYEVELIVTRPGSLDPDQPYDENSASVNITVAPWGEKVNVKEEI